MLIGRPSDIPSSEITPHAVYLRRRELMAAAAAIGLSTLVPSAPRAAPLPAATSPFSTPEVMTAIEDVTGYNNFYEFGTGKGDPAAYAHALTTAPWTVKVDGLVGKPGDYVICLGAGNITQWAYALPAELEALGK